MTYIDTTRATLEARCPDEDPALLDLYLLLALIKGDMVTLADVHDAWAIWRSRTSPDHRSIVPFGQLTPAVQELDQPYADAIAAVGNALDEQTACLHPDGYDGECPCPPSCGCCRVVAAQQEQAAPVDWQATVRARERELKHVGEARHQADAALARIRHLAEEHPVAIPTNLIDAALDQTAAHDSGPTVAEAAADDRAHWDNKHAGEGV